MPVATSSAIRNRTRLATAVAMAAFSTWFNRGGTVTTPTDAVEWFLVSAVLLYLLFTLLRVAADRVRGDPGDG
ncbi:hypothetical protein [Haloarchaeobius sp. TZWSO28]|uniref:hypothetical protein n=1 Tax=Haloarchaeobius sp. TZWSO28 TaxID=3446119 RepID=UPI003EBAC241